MRVARDRAAASFSRRAQLAGLMLLGCVSLAWAADKVAPELTDLVSDDFLEYLGSLESGDGNWTDFVVDAATHDSVQDPVKSGLPDKDNKTAVKSGGTAAAGATTNAASPATGKADK